MLNRQHCKARAPVFFGLESKVTKCCLRFVCVLCQSLGKGIWFLDETWYSLLKRSPFNLKTCSFSLVSHLLSEPLNVGFVLSNQFSEQAISRIEHVLESLKNQLPVWQWTDDFVWFPCTWVPMKTLKVPDLVGGKLLVVTMLDFLLVWPFFI